MAKDRSFQAKVAKSQLGPVHPCPVCKESIVTYHVVRTARNEDKNSWRFKEKFIGVCKCNEKEILG